MKRRDFIKFSTAAAAAYTMGHSLNSFADSKDIGNVVVILCRGGMDGVAAIQPMQQSRLQDIRESCYIKTPLKLTADFDLHPKLSNFKSHWDNNNAAAVHATGFSYSGRSHFDGQNIMEVGSYKPYTVSTGWLGRAMELKGLSSLALNLPTPIIARSLAPTSNFYPSKLIMPQHEDALAIKKLWANDPVLSGYCDDANLDETAFDAGLSDRGGRDLAVGRCILVFQYCPLPDRRYCAASLAQWCRDGGILGLAAYDGG